MSKTLTVKLIIVGAALAAASWLCLADVFVTPGALPPGMHQAAPQRSIALFLLCISLWLTNLIPLPATSLLAIAMLPLLNILPKDRAFALFGNSAVFFLLGVFLMAGAMISTGLSKRLTLIALHRFDRSPTQLFVGVTVSACFLAVWMPAYAVAAMIYPIVVEIVATLKLERKSRYAKKLFLGLAWGSVIGGVGTFLGGARAPLALSLLRDAYPDKSIGFLWWMAAAMPVVVVMIAVALAMLHFRIPNDIDNVRAATRMLKDRVRRLGPMSARERRLAILALLTIVAWMVVGVEVGLAVIATLSAVMLFVLRIAEWKAIQEYVNWAVLIMYGGAVALGMALTETGAMSWIAHRVIDPGVPQMAVLALIVVAAILLTEGISNAAAVAILLPIGYSIGETIGIGPILITFVVTVPAGLAFLLPISSPPNAISFSAGHYGVREVVQLGWPMTIASLLTVLVVMLVWWGPVLNINAW